MSHPHLNGNTDRVVPVSVKRRLMFQHTLPPPAPATANGFNHVPRQPSDRIGRHVLHTQRLAHVGKRRSSPHRLRRAHLPNL